MQTIVRSVAIQPDCPRAGRFDGVAACGSGKVNNPLEGYVRNRPRSLLKNVGERMCLKVTAHLSSASNLR